MVCWFFTRYLFLSLAIICVFCYSLSFPAQAANIDPYIVKYLRVHEPIALDTDEKGHQREFSPQELSRGKQLYENNCINCHVGGSTLPNPLISLSLKTLKGANPPRDNINALVAYMRQPMTYDGSEETLFCRLVAPSFLSQQDVENLAAFVLTAAKKAPGWGNEKF